MAGSYSASRGQLEPERGARRDEAAVGVAEQERAVARVADHGGHVVALALERVLVAVGGVAAPAPVDRDHGERRSRCGRSRSKLQRAEPAPCTSTSGGPAPLTSQAIRTPSGGLT